MRKLSGLFLIGILVFWGWGIYKLIVQSRGFEEKAMELRRRSASLKESISQTKEDLKYYSESENIEKEARAQFNFRQPGEKLIILVPQQKNQ